MPDHDDRGYGLLSRRALGPSPWEPPVDVLVGTEVAWIRIAAPGAAPDDLHVVARGYSVTVTGCRSVLRPPPELWFQQAEIVLGPFRRCVRLPWVPHPRRIDTRAHHGIVEVLLARLASEGIDRG